MESQKRENLLNLALQVTEEERQKSLELNVGVMEGDRWEIIVKYHGNVAEKLEQLEKQYATSFQTEFLLPGYAILTVNRRYLDSISDLPEIDYIEKPKALYEEAVSIDQANRSSCVAEVTLREPFLTGKGVLIGIPDSGIDYKDAAFLTPDGNTKIAYLWDQTKEGRAPVGFYGGTEFSGEEINQSIVNDTEITFDRSGHGTTIADICVGEGAADESELLIVKLGSGNEQGFSRTTELMRAITWMLQKASELEKPLVINISYGNTYGAHDGTTLLETFLDTAADVYKTVICVGSGNEGAAAGHIALVCDEETQVEWSIVPFQEAINISFWKNYIDQISLTLVSPSGQREKLQLSQPGKQEIILENTRLILYIGEPTPYSQLQEYYFEFQAIDEIQGNGQISTGIWKLLISPVNVVDGYCSLYMPSAVVLGSGTNFYRATSDTTLTIPSTANKVITVGAYDIVYEEYADFSGRGYALFSENERREGTVSRESGLWKTRVQKPDLCAPGVDILVRDGRGGFQVVSGTSFAAPFVTAAAALLMEWGIVRGNDPYLYGEKVKAYLCRGAKELRGILDYPNERAGWGALCVERSLPYRT